MLWPRLYSLHSRFYGFLNRPFAHRSERGAAFTEYAVLIALVAVAIIAALTAFKDSLSALFDRLAAQLADIGN